MIFTIMMELNDSVEKVPNASFDTYLLKSSMNIQFEVSGKRFSCDVRKGNESCSRGVKVFP